jgi:hypothetical protein
MKKSLLLVVLAIFFLRSGQAQTTEAEEKLKANSTDTIDGWKYAGTIFLNLSQTSLTNWAAGGENSLAINGLISVSANYKKGNTTWGNSLDIGYGMLKQGDKDFVKTDDKIDFLSKFGQKAFKNTYYAALLNLKTQMDKGYNYPNDSIAISKFLAPAYILGAIGLDYRPTDNFSLFLSPVTAKITLINDQALADSGAYGVDRGKKSRSEFGGYIRAIYQRDIMKNISLSTKIDLFTNYLKNPQNIDVNWETLITLKVNKYISASISTTLIYDDDILIAKDENDDGLIDPQTEMSPRTQFKEVLAIGFTYKF